jgi:hypothetical protein
LSSAKCDFATADELTSSDRSAQIQLHHFSVSINFAKVRAYLLAEVAVASALMLA